MSNPLKPIPPRPVALFEVNLLGDRIAELRRRQGLGRIFTMAALLLIAMTCALIILTGMHLMQAARLRSGIDAGMLTLKSQQRVCDELDAKRQKLLAELRPLLPLIPVAKERIVWAPKLAALSQELAPGSGLRSVNASSGDFFVAKGATKGPKVNARESDQPHFAFVVLCPVGDEDDPTQLCNRLQRSATFRGQGGTVILEGAQEESVDGRPVISLRGRCTVGVPKP